MWHARARCDERDQSRRTRTTSTLLHAPLVMRIATGEDRRHRQWGDLPRPYCDFEVTPRSGNYAGAVRLGRGTSSVAQQIASHLSPAKQHRKSRDVGGRCCGLRPGPDVFKRRQNAQFVRACWAWLDRKRTGGWTRVDTIESRRCHGSPVFGCGWQVGWKGFGQPFEPIHRRISHEGIGPVTTQRLPKQ